MGLINRKVKPDENAANESTVQQGTSLVGDSMSSIDSGGSPPAPDSGDEDSGGKKKKGLFGGGGKKKEKPQKPAKADKKADKKVAPKKKRSELVKVLDESVWESVHEDFKANKQFIMKEDGEVKYVAFLFDTEQVGGLAGRENKKDESKGTIIEAIRTGHIKTYIRVEMLMDDAFIIIPDVDTIDNMDEFNLFHSADYVLCTVSPEGTITTITQGGTDMDDDPEVTVKFEDIKKIISINGDVRGLFPSGAAYRPKVHEDSPFDTVLSESGMAPARGVNVFADDYDPDADAEPLPDDMYGDGGSDPDGAEPLPDEEDPDAYEDVPPYEPETEPEPVAQAPQPVQEPAAPAPEPDYEAPQQAGPAPVSAQQPQAQPVFNFGGDQADQDEGGYDEYAGITEEVVKDYVTRHFYSDDLGLEVSADPFDSQFLHGNSYLPFQEDRGSGWLNEYLSQFSRDANTRMERIHGDNLFRMRERYMRLIQNHCSEIAKALDITDDSTQYGRLRFAIEQNRDDNLASVDSTVAAKREQLEQAWREELEQVGRAAAMSAQQAHIQRYGRTHESDILKLETMEKDEVERDYKNSMRRLHEDRRREASKMLDMAINETLNEMASIYIRVLREEKREYIRLQNEMTKFIDDNRKDEKARIAALAEENRQIKRANEVRNEFTAKIQAMAAEFDMKKTTLQAEIDSLNREHDIEIHRMESEWSGRLGNEKKHCAELEEQLAEMMDRFTKLDGQKNEEYKERIQKLEAEKDDWNRQTDHIIETHRRSNLISTMLVVAIMIAAIGIGFMLGSIINVRRTSSIEQDSIYNQRIEEQQNTLPDGGTILLPLGEDE